MSRYGAGIAAVAVLIASIVALPSDRGEERGALVGGDRPSRDSTSDRSVGVDPDDTAVPTDDATTDEVTRRARGRVGARPITPQEAEAQGLDVDFGPNCDPATGRVRVPSIFAPPCVPPHSGPNGGRTYQGVTEKEIVVAVYIPAANPAVEAIFASGGGETEASDPEATEATHRAYAEFFESHYETYGRDIRIEVVRASGQDAQSAKADAIRVAEEINAFASIRGPYAQAVYAKELAARGVLCIECINALPNEHYINGAPHIWGLAMSWHQGALEQAEYICKRLWGKKAKWAGDAVIQQQQRVLGMIYFDTADGDYKSGPPFFEKTLDKNCGGTVKVTIGYTLDLPRAQDQARTWIAKMKDEDVTTIYLPTDPLYPMFITQEATRQNYFPEWGVLSYWNEANFFARLFDQTQWAHAFGAASRATPTPEQISDAWRLHRWHHGRDPDTRCCYWAHWQLFTGVHLAGPNLTPQTFRDGMFSFPPTGGGPTTPHISFGRHGLWPFDDYLAIDDKAEVWWDPQAPGPDEAGNQGVGMYRYVDGGSRYLFGEWARGDPRVFDRAGTATIYNEIPPEDRPPDYDHKHY